MTSLDAPRRRARAKPRFGGLLTAISFGLVGLLFGLHNLAEVALRHIVTPDVSLAFQEVSDNLPVPRALDWNLPMIQALMAVRAPRGPAFLVLQIAALVALGVVFLWTVLNRADRPRFSRRARRVATLPDADPLTGAGTEPQFRRWLPKALLYGIAAIALMLFGTPSVSDLLFRYFHTLGTFHQDFLLRLALPSLISCAAIWAGVGLALFALCASILPSARRAAIAACAVPLFALAAWCQVGLRVQAFAKRMDWSPGILTTAPRSGYGTPDGFSAAQLLAKQVELSFGNQPEQGARPLILLMPAAPANLIPGAAYNAIQEGFTEDGLTASLESAGPVQAFLDRRHYETALSWVAIKHLFNVATVHFDTTTAMDACMTDLERCPHLGQSGLTLRTMLFTCSAAPVNEAIVERWADKRRFAHPTRESKRLMGQLFERFGDKAKALVWYRRADMPQSFLRRVENERPLFHSGRVSGVLTLNGKPLAGVRVGVLPRRLNGLPADLEPAVLRSRDEVVPFRPHGLFPPMHPRPYALRWISAAATSDAAGRFEITDLTEGEYMLVFTLPPAIRLMPPQDMRLVVSQLPPPLIFNYKKPALDLGTIGLTLRN